MPAYYNEIDGYAAQWLRNLIAADIIAPGDVDERSIVDIRASDLAGYEQCHFFAGIGGWSYALRIAGWPDDRPVWTGSCPCQPFSVAGRQKSFEDSRHLWPNWRELIAEHRPATIFGEQVANAPQWVRLVRGDLEVLAYSVGCIPIEAASAGAFHFRDRYWLVADRDGVWEHQSKRHIGEQWKWAENGSGGLGLGLMAECDGERSQIAVGQPSDIGAKRTSAARNGICDVARDSRSERRTDAEGRRNVANGDDLGWQKAPSRSSVCAETSRAGGMADSAGDGWGEGWTESELRGWGPTASVCSIDGCQIIECPDGKWRRLPPPRVRWLGTRLPARISRVRAFGNAIDPRPASAFIAAFMECQP